MSRRQVRARATRLWPATTAAAAATAVRSEAGLRYALTAGAPGHEGASGDGKERAQQSAELCAVASFSELTRGLLRSRSLLGDHSRRDLPSTFRDRDEY